MPPRDNVYKEVGEVADAGLFIGFGAPVRGREARRWSSSTRRRVLLAATGRGRHRKLRACIPRVARRRSRWVHPHSRGGREARIARVSDEFTQFTIRADLIVDKFGVVGADLAGRLERNMEFYIEQIGALA